MGYVVMGETRKEKEKKGIRIAIWDFVVKGGRERGTEKKREKRVKRKAFCPISTIYPKRAKENSAEDIISST